MGPPPYLLTVDLGTSVVKATLFSLGAPLPEAVAQGASEYPTDYPAPGWAEQDPEAWWGAALAAAGQLPEDLRRRVAGVGLSSHRGGIVPVDGALQPLSRCIIWMDRRSRSELEAMVEALGRERVHRVTGLVPDTEFSASKILWLRRHAPDVFRAARVYLQPRDYLYLRLTGSPATDYTLASRTMLLDIARRTWWEDGCGYVGVSPAAFPPVYSSTAAPHGVRPEAARALGIPSGVPVALGAGDRPCEVLGSGAGDGRVMVSTGTTTNVSAASRGIPDALDPRVMCSLHALEGRYVVEQGLSASGSILRWVRDTLQDGRVGYRELDQLASAVPAGSEGLVFLPFMMGARATRWDPHARGVWYGLTEAHGLGALVRSIMEGVAYEVRACLDLLEGMGLPQHEVVAVGGGARSRVWSQILADVAGRPVVVPRETDAASLGAALLAAAALGHLQDPEREARRGNPAALVCSPDPAAGARYGVLRDLYDRLYEALRPVFAELAGEG